MNLLFVSRIHSVLIFATFIQNGYSITIGPNKQYTQGDYTGCPMPKAIRFQDFDKKSNVQSLRAWKTSEKFQLDL